jgi:hypothetical protein
VLSHQVLLQFLLVAVSGNGRLVVTRCCSCQYSSADASWSALAARSSFASSSTADCISAVATKPIAPTATPRIKRAIPNFTA